MGSPFFSVHLAHQVDFEITLGEQALQLRVLELQSCAARKDRGEAVCSGVAVARTTVDERLLPSIRSELLSPAALARVHARIRAAHPTNGNAQRERRIAHLDAEITRLVNAIAAMGISPGLQARLKDTERERAELVEQRDAPTREIADVGAAYRRLVTNLSSALRKDSPRARAALAEIFGGGIRLVPEGEAVFAEIPISANRLILRAESYLSGPRHRFQNVPDTWVTLSRLSRGGVYAVEGVFGNGRASAVCGQAVGWRSDERGLPRVRHLAQDRLQDLRPVQR